MPKSGPAGTPFHSLPVSIITNKQKYNYQGENNGLFIDLAADIISLSRIPVRADRFDTRNVNPLVAPLPAVRSSLPDLRAVLLTVHVSPEAVNLL